MAVHFLLTVADVAILLGVKESRVRGWVQRGIIPTERIPTYGGTPSRLRTRFREDFILNWLDSL